MESEYFQFCFTLLVLGCGAGASGIEGSWLLLMTALVVVHVQQCQGS